MPTARSAPRRAAIGGRGSLRLAASLVLVGMVGVGLAADEAMSRD